MNLSNFSVELSNTFSGMLFNGLTCFSQCLSVFVGLELLAKFAEFDSPVFRRTLSFIIMRMVLFCVGHLCEAIATVIMRFNE